ncbi:MAG: TonB-dependent receptor [Gemmatimonadaceae bacterium]|nr:TonB-dependent receptor [Gemmatimonadaceae bacterium]
MFRQLFVCACIAAPVCAAAQQAAVPDSIRRDSISRADSARARAAARLAVVTITATAVRPTESRQAIHVTPADIAQTPATSPWDLLRQTAGVEVHLQGQGPGFASDASVRGFSSDHSTDLALWIDGVPINEPVNAHAEGYNDMSLIFPQAIRDLDVIKGPTSALFGNFAVSGIVNVRTLDHLDGTRVWINGGSAGHIEGTALSGFGNDSGSSAHGVVGARYVHEGGWRPNSDYDLGQGHVRLVHDFTPNTTIDGGVELYGSRWNSAGYLSEDEFRAHEYDIVSNPTDQGHKLHAQERASLRVVDGNMLWRSTVYATQGQWRLFLTIPPAGGIFEGDGIQTEEDDDRFGFGATSALTWQLSRAEITVGAEGRFDQSHYQNWFTTDRARDSSQALIRAHQFGGGVFVQSGIDVTSRLRLDIGVRYDAVDTHSESEGEDKVQDSRGVFSPKLGALVKLTDALGVYANVSRGFRATDGIIEDPTLPFITVWAYEGGLKWNGNGVRATAALFRMDVSNEQTFNPLTSGSSSGGASRRQGVELALRAPMSKSLTFTGDWTFNDARYKRLIATAEGDETQVDTLSGERVYNTAKYIGSAALQWARPGSLWSVRLSTNAVGPYSPFDEPGVVLPAYALLHASATRKIGKAELEIGVRNILDKAYPELVAGGLVAPGQPIAAFGTVSYTF